MSFPIYINIKVYLGYTQGKGASLMPRVRCNFKKRKRVSILLSGLEFTLKSTASFAAIKFRQLGSYIEPLIRLYSPIVFSRENNNKQE